MMIEQTIFFSFFYRIARNVVLPATKSEMLGAMFTKKKKNKKKKTAAGLA